MLASVCIMTHERVEETKQTLESIHQFKGLELELCIADNSRTDEAKEAFKEMSDHYATVTDKQLWKHGFGYCKQKAVDLSTQDWILYPDPGEIWHENFIETEGLVAMIDHTHGNVPAFRIRRGDSKVVQAVLGRKTSVNNLGDDNGRIFNKQVLKMMGFIHEAPLHKGTGQLWSAWARKWPALALAEHDGGAQDSPQFAKRKKILYDHLIATIAKNPRLRPGTDFYWWTTYWKNVEPDYEEISYKKWQKACYGGENE
jgi:hypothetical protein